jgi:hypothetical protein
MLDYVASSGYREVTGTSLGLCASTHLSRTYLLQRIGIGAAVGRIARA